MTKKEFALQILRQNSPFDEETLDRILYGYGWNGGKSLKTLIEIEMGEFGNEKAPQKTDEDLISDILCGMNKFILSYPAAPLFKQRLWLKFKDWIDNIAKYYNISEVEILVNDYMIQPVEDDPYVAILKSIHSMDEKHAVTKEDLVQKLRVDERTIRNRLNQLDPDLNKDDKKRKNKTPNKNLPRFAGQILQVHIESAYDKNVRKYYTSESLQPVALQMNVTQVGLLMKGLQIANDTDVSDYSLDLAIDVWTQLSPYCQQRLKDKYHPDDDDLHDFMNTVDDIAYDEGADHLFKSEVEMFEGESIRNQLNMAFKGERICRILLKNSDKAIKNCRIDYRDGKYYIHSENEVQEVTADEIQEIGLIRE